MIYFDNGATTLQKPRTVMLQSAKALRSYANPGRSGHRAAMDAARAVFQCRERLGDFFRIPPDRVCFTMNATHGLNIAIHTLIRPGDRVVISGYEHNAVTRPLHLRGADTVVAGKTLFEPELAVKEFEAAVTPETRAVILNHVSNVFGYIQPLAEIAKICRGRGVPLIVDASQSAGILPISMEELGAAFIAMPGHKGLYGPQGTGVLLCGRRPEPLLAGGTGSQSERQDMPEDLPDRVEAGTVNVPGICGLAAGVEYVMSVGCERILTHERRISAALARGLKSMGCQVFDGAGQGSGVLSFLTPSWDCEELADRLASAGICVRSGLHCAPLAHRSAGTEKTGTVRISLSAFNTDREAAEFLRVMGRLTNQAAGPDTPLPGRSQVGRKF